MLSARALLNEPHSILQAFPTALHDRVAHAPPNNFPVSLLVDFVQTQHFSCVYHLRYCSQWHNWQQMARECQRNLFSNCCGHQICRSPSLKIVKMSTQAILINDHVVYLTCGILLRMHALGMLRRSTTAGQLHFYCSSFTYPTAHCVSLFMQGAMDELPPSRPRRIAKPNLYSNLSPSSQMGEQRKP